MEKTLKKPNFDFSRILLALLFYTILVILWGAWVRISHSGDGCGDSWPLCQGQIIPDSKQSKTWIELGHRLMSGTFGLMILALFFYVRRLFPKGHPIRFWAGLSLIFTVSEALLGAKLVIFGLVTDNDSPYRAFIMSLHLINSLMLTGSLTLTWEFSKSSQWLKRQKAPWNLTSLKVQQVIFGVLFSFMVIAITGAIAALSNTLFPSTSLAEGLAADWAEGSHFLVRLRSFHPISGILLGSFVALTAWLSIQLFDKSETLLIKRSRNLTILTSTGIIFGILTLVSLAPVWLKLTHLLIAHLIWISLVLWITSLRFHSHSLSSQNKSFH